MEEHGRLSTRSLLIAIRNPLDRVAWTEFFKRYQPVIVGVCKSLNLGHFDAEDVAQEILTAIARRARTFTFNPARPGGFGGYIRKITRNAVYDLRLAQGRSDAHQGGDWILAVSDAQAVRQVEHSLRRERERELLEMALERVCARLSEGDRLFFQTIFMEDLGVKEAAEALGQKVSWVYVRTHRWRKQLDEELRMIRNEDRI